jgi:hypothetical protein
VAEGIGELRLAVAEGRFLANPIKRGEEVGKKSGHFPISCVSGGRRARVGQLAVIRLAGRRGWLPEIEDLDEFRYGSGF